MTPDAPRRSSVHRAGSAVRLLRSEGLGALRERVSEEVRPRLMLNERHVWYRMDLLDLPQVRPLPPQARLVAVTEDTIAALTTLPTIGPDEARKRLAAGHEGWLVLEGDEPLFACWVFRDEAPVLAAAGGQLALPAHVRMLEDSVTAPAGRGRGVAPATWTSIAPVLAVARVRTLITKVAVDNVPSRKAVLKAGFVPTAVIEYRSVGGRRGTTRLHPAEVGETSIWLASALPASSVFAESRGTTFL